MGDGIEPRLMEELDVPRVGAVARGAANSLPWRLVDSSGVGVDHVNLWLAELYACDSSPATLRAYAYDLLSWTRFLDAIGTHWARATRNEVRDWVRWYRSRENPQRRRASGGSAQRPNPGSVNEVTGKLYLDASYAPSSINRRLSSLSGFYEFAVESDLGPLINPVPNSREELNSQPTCIANGSTRHAAESVRPTARSSGNERRAHSATTCTKRYSRRCGTNRDRAIVATAVSAGLRASELLEHATRNASRRGPDSRHHSEGR